MWTRCVIFQIYFCFLVGLKRNCLPVATPLLHTKINPLTSVPYPTSVFQKQVSCWGMPSYSNGRLSTVMMDSASCQATTGLKLCREAAHASKDVSSQAICLQQLYGLLFVPSFFTFIVFYHSCLLSPALFTVSCMENIQKKKQWTKSDRPSIIMNQIALKCCSIRRTVSILFSVTTNHCLCRAYCPIKSQDVVYSNGLVIGLFDRGRKGLCVVQCSNIYSLFFLCLI